MKDRWTSVYRAAYTGTEGNDGIVSLAEYRGSLYLGAGRFPSASSSVCSAIVCRRDLASDAAQWQEFTPPWSPLTNGYSMAMCAFQERLFVGNDQGEVWRTDGQTWEALANPGFDKVSAMVEFRGSLYVATLAATIWRIASDGSWHPVVDAGGAQPAQFGDPTNKDISSLEVFSGQLYAGVGKDGADGIEIWRTADGANWERFHAILPQGLGQTPGHVHAMKSHGDYLYVALYHGRVVCRTDGSLAPEPGHWSGSSELDVPGDVFRLAEHRGLLYLGLWCTPTAGSIGAPLLYSSANGLLWTPAEGGPVVDSSSHTAWSLLSSGDSPGRLYLGTRSLAPAGSGEVRLWRLAPEPEVLAGVIRLTWAWEILFGSILLLTPGGVFCLTCGDAGLLRTALVNVAGLGSIVAGVAGLLKRIQKG